MRKFVLAPFLLSLLCLLPAAGVAREAFEHPMLGMWSGSVSFRTTPLLQGRALTTKVKIRVDKKGRVGISADGCLMWGAVDIEQTTNRSVKFVASARKCANGEYNREYMGVLLWPEKGKNNLILRSSDYDDNEQAERSFDLVGMVGWRGGPELTDID